jgi:hypothetical protein
MPAAGGSPSATRYAQHIQLSGLKLEDLELELLKEEFESMHCRTVRRRHEELWSVLALSSTRPEHYADFAN